MLHRGAVGGVPPAARHRRHHRYRTTSTTATAKTRRGPACLRLHQKWSIQ
nr:MAG TPA: hypothetical protein [Caudoviricetes sp.]